MTAADENRAGTDANKQVKNEDAAIKDRALFRVPLLVDARAAAAIIGQLISKRDSGEPQKRDLIPAPVFLDTEAATAILGAIDKAFGRGAQKDDGQRSDGERAAAPRGKRSKAA